MSRFTSNLGAIIGALGIGAAAVIFTAFSSHYSTDTLPALAANDIVGTPQMVSPISGRGPSETLPKPIKRIVHADNTCAGVVRSDGSRDGECSAASANLPTIPFDEALPVEEEPLD